MKSQEDDIKNYMNMQKFDMLNDDQRFVNETLEKSSYDIKWLASKIRMDYDLVRYQLRNATNYRQDVHARIIDVFKKEGLVTSHKEATDKLKDDIISFNQVLNGTLSIVTKGIKERLPNGIDEQEKLELKQMLRGNLNRITDEFNDLLITIDMQ